ncbi:MAG: GNAT family N-acetyltransferase [Phycisphaerales bacterium]|nr:GNAT family N-acetyltransferase [Phycisphaerales bacterium]
MSLAVRPTLPTDVPGILKLIAAVYAEYGQILNTDEEPHVLCPGPYFGAHGGEFWVVADQDEVLATCGVKVEEGVAELKTLYVHPSLRRMGWGKRLVERAMEHARSRGATMMMLWSDTRFVDAHRLYRRLAFEHDGLRELKDSNLTWEYGFSRQL